MTRPASINQRATDLRARAAFILSGLDHAATRAETMTGHARTQAMAPAVDAIALTLTTRYGARIHLLTTPPRMTLHDVTVTCPTGGADLLRAWANKAIAAAAREERKADA